MAINSKKKGNKAELQVSKQFATWTGFEFQRVPQSGGLRWSNRDSIVGDIICCDKEHKDKFPFTVEVKSYNKIDFNHLLLPVKSDISKFWQQSLEEGAAVGKVPLLLMRYNGLPKDFWFVVISQYHIKKIRENCPISIRRLIKPSMAVISNGHAITILPSTAFFKIPYKKIYDILS